MLAEGEGISNVYLSFEKKKNTSIRKNILLIIETTNCGMAGLVLGR